MDKRATIHIPAERHRQLQEIATRRGFSKITDFLDDWIRLEAAELGLTEAKPFRVERTGGGFVVAVEKMPPLVMSEADARELLRMVGDCIASRCRDVIRLNCGLLVEFGLQGRGYSLGIGTASTKQAEPQWQRRGLRESLAQEFRDALQEAIGQ